MSFIDDQFDDYLMQDALGYNDTDEPMYYDDSHITARRQRPATPYGVDWRRENE